MNVGETKIKDDIEYVLVEVRETLFPNGFKRKEKKWIPKKQWETMGIIFETHVDIKDYNFNLSEIL